MRDRRIAAWLVLAYPRSFREAVGPDFDLMVDAHTWWRMGDSNYSLATVERLAEAMAEHHIAWLEEPLPPDDHAAYLDAWINALNLPSVVFVGYDWGAALAFDWAARHPGRVRAVAFMEPIVRPLATTEFPEAARAMFAALRTPRVGERMVLQENIFIEQALAATVQRGLASDELQVYRQPYPTPESRRPMLAWPRMMPLDGQPAEVVVRIEAYDQWLATSDHVPKLLMTCPPGPGLMMTPGLIDWCRNHIAALELAELGPAGHHVPEDQSPAIADELVQWLLRHDLCEAPVAPRGGSVTEDA